MITEPEDEALLAGMASDDEDAARAFVGRHAPTVIGVAYRIVGNITEAEDVAQQTFWRAWRAASTYDPRRGSVRAWLLTIARNSAIDVTRVRRMDPSAPEKIARLLERDPTGAPVDEGLQTADEAAEVRSALERLPEDQRRAVLLATVAGLTAAEVGTAEGIPLGTAKTRIRTGLRRLRDYLEVEARRGL